MGGRSGQDTGGGSSSGGGESNSTIATVNAITTAKSAFEKLTPEASGKSVYSGGARYKGAEYSKEGEAILLYIKESSAGFQKDIAKKALDGQPLSEKQRWAVSYEFIKTKDGFKDWTKKTVQYIR